MSLIEEMRERHKDAQDRITGLNSEIEKLTGLRDMAMVRVDELGWLIKRLEEESGEQPSQAAPQGNGAEAEAAGRRNIRGEVERAIVESGRNGISSAELSLKLDARPAGVELATVYLSDPKRRRIVERQARWYEPGSAPVHMETTDVPVVVVAATHLVCPQGGVCSFTPEKCANGLSCQKGPPGVEESDGNAATVRSPEPAATGKSALFG